MWRDQESPKSSYCKKHICHLSDYIAHTSWGKATDTSGASRKQRSHTHTHIYIYFTFYYNTVQGTVVPVQYKTQHKHKINTISQDHHKPIVTMTKLWAPLNAALLLFYTKHHFTQNIITSHQTSVWIRQAVLTQSWHVTKHHGDVFPTSLCKWFSVLSTCAADSAVEQGYKGSSKKLQTGNLLAKQYIAKDVLAKGDKYITLACHTHLSFIT